MSIMVADSSYYVWVSWIIYDYKNHMEIPIKKNSQEEFIQAHEDYVDMLRKSAFFKVHSKSLSEDLVQETFLKTWKYVVRGGEIATMKAFLYHVLNNLIIDEYRKQQHNVSSLELMMENGFDVATNEHNHKGESIDLEAAIEYINKLPKKYKEVVHENCSFNVYG